LNEQQQTPHNHLKRAYILIHIVLFLPVLLWPLPIVIFGNPMLADRLFPTWMLCVAVQLMVTVGMDSMLYRVSSFKQGIDTALWVSLFAIFTISTLQRHESAWLFGVLFLIHSFRAAYPLLKAQPSANHWWLSLAWLRDITTTFIIFFWLNINASGW